MSDRRFSAREAIALLTDEFTELPTRPREYAPDGPLAWQGYAASRTRAAERTGEEESVVWGRGVIGGAAGATTSDTTVATPTGVSGATPTSATVATPTGTTGATPTGTTGTTPTDTTVATPTDTTGTTPTDTTGAAPTGVAAVLISFEFGFLGGSLGERTGDRLESAYTYAREHRLPVVSLIATGGSRMQEGMRALTQLQRVARQSALTRAAGLPQIAVLRDPTTGGGWATLGAGADVILALPGAQVGFAGSRVRPPDADPAAYTAESQVAAGSADAVVHPEDLRETLTLWLTLLTTPSTPPAPPPHALPTPAPPPQDLPTPAPPPQDLPTPAPPPQDLPTPAPPPHALPTPAPHPAPPKGRRPLRGAGNCATGHNEPAAATEPLPPPHEAPLPTLPATGWEAVSRARSPQRPRADAYLDAYFTHRTAISGDRAGGTDPGMLCGFGEHDGRTIAYAAQRGTATRPAGYRTAARLIRLADRLGIPVLTLVDTPGAANDADAERQGAGAAIADLFTAVATARTPVTTLLIGEGGSGGALALAAPDNTWATPDSYFSVIAPELAAAILKRPEERVRATADELRLRPQDLVELGVVQGVVQRVVQGADRPGAPRPPG